MRLRTQNATIFSIIPKSEILITVVDTFQKSDISIFWKIQKRMQ